MSWCGYMSTPEPKDRDRGPTVTDFPPERCGNSVSELPALCLDLPSCPAHTEGRPRQLKLLFVGGGCRPFTRHIAVERQDSGPRWDARACGAVSAISDPQNTGICLIHGPLMCKEEIRRSDDTGFVAIRAVNCPVALCW